MGLEGSVLCNESLTRLAEVDENAVIDIELGQHCKALWEDPDIQQVWERRKEFQIVESVKYYFDKLDEIMKPEYLATRQDMLYTRVRTSGIVTERLVVLLLFECIVIYYYLRRKAATFAVRFLANRMSLSSSSLLSGCVCYFHKLTLPCVVRYDIDGSPFEIYDVGGQRNERKKWIHCFDDVTAVIFVVALSEYDQTLFEDSTTNRLLEAVELFGDICNNR